MSMLVKSCSFCDRPVAKGSGTMFVKNDGTVMWFCRETEREAKKIR